MQSQGVFAVLGRGAIGEGRVDGLAFVPIGELVGIVAAAGLTVLAGGDEEDRFVPIRGVGNETHGGSMVFCSGANAVTGARLRLVGDAEDSLQQAVATDRMKHLERVEALP